MSFVLSSGRRIVSTVFLSAVFFRCYVHRCVRRGVVSNVPGAAGRANQVVALSHRRDVADVDLTVTTGMISLVVAGVFRVRTFL